jgi:hypothetical protein
MTAWILHSDDDPLYTILSVSKQRVAVFFFTTTGHTSVCVRVRGGLWVLYIYIYREREREGERDLSYCHTVMRSLL